MTGQFVNTHTTCHLIGKKSAIASHAYLAFNKLRSYTK